MIVFINGVNGTMRKHMTILARIGGIPCLALMVMGAATGKPDAPNPVTEPDAKRYADCMTLIRDKPEQAYRMATTWGKEGGGHPARHCAAVAMIDMGMPHEAARRLEDLANGVSRDATGNKGVKNDAMRSNLLAQAASAWMIAAKPKAAYALQTKAMKLRPRDVELLIDRSISLAGMGMYWEAIDDLNHALEIGPGRIEALVFRASAYRRVQSPELATEDIERALGIDPTHPGALLESGNIRIDAGDKDGARRDWIKILRLAPWSHPAETARRNLEKIDVKTK
jgi:tetratricopeptide (TPR) repeat protein